MNVQYFYEILQHLKDTAMDLKTQLHFYFLEALETKDRHIINRFLKKFLELVITPFKGLSLPLNYLSH